MTTPTHEQLAASAIASALQSEGDVRRVPRALLRLEGGALLSASVAAYAYMDGGWWMFALLFLLPDLSMLGYLANRKIGAALYNGGHTTLAPAVMGAIGLAVGVEPLAQVALIWLAHIGFDRLLGYGLKYDSAFGHTHLGQAGSVGQRRSREVVFHSASTFKR